MHVVAVLALHGVVAMDLAIPCGVFGPPSVAGRRPYYKVMLCAEAKTVRSSHFNIVAPYALEHIAKAQTVIVPGVEDTDAAISPRVIAALRAAAKRGARIASICSGAFVLAAAGLLDGRRATTHWLGGADLARRYPEIAVDPNVLFIDEGKVLTSAGAAAGLDLCLHLVRKDQGAAAAADAARLAVMPLERRGGQAQFIKHAPPQSHASLTPLLRWIDENLAATITVSDMARRAATSLRTFNRRFRQQMGTTPLQWLLTARIRRSQSLLETTHESIERIAMLVGFESAGTFRDRFRRGVGLSPTEYRRSFFSGTAVVSSFHGSPRAVRTTSMNARSDAGT